MALFNKSPKSNVQQFFEELNHHFPDCQVEVSPDASVWVFGYPTKIVYDESRSLGQNVEGAVKELHSFLITAV
jgi:hypothetical protein